MTDHKQQGGPRRFLIAVYAVFALAACARAAVQIATRFEQAPVAYSLSAGAAAIYVLATVSLARGGLRWRYIAIGACLTELIGVVTIGTVSLMVPEYFPRATVWSFYGAGYGGIPLVLPFLGLYSLWQSGRGTAGRVKFPSSG